MRTAITVGFDETGKASLIAGPDVPADEQREAFSKAVSGKLPKDCVRVELWLSDQGRSKKAICPKHNRRLAAEAAEAAKEAEEAAKKEAAKKAAAAAKPESVAPAKQPANKPAAKPADTVKPAKDAAKESAPGESSPT